MAKIVHWLSRALLVVFALVALAELIGVLYQNIAATRDLREHPMPGTLVDVGGYRLHINCMGHGSPTVVLDAGAGISFNSWRKVQPQIATFTQVCSYDRAGLGYSEASPFPRTSRVIAQELQKLLVNSQIAPPYVMVGHSLGGFNVRVYTSQNPSSVVGMILVDSSHPDQFNRYPPIVRKQVARDLRNYKLFEWQVPFGIPRLRKQCGSDPVDITLDCTFRDARAWVGETEALPESAAQAALTGPFGDIPLSVLSHDPEKLPPEFSPDVGKIVNDIWEKMQEELATLSTQGTQKTAKNSSHFVQIDRPELVVEEVRKIVEKARR